MADAGAERPSMNPALATGLKVIGYLLLVVAGWVYLVSGLVVPGPWLFFLWAFWIGLLVWAIYQRHHPWRVVAAPFIAAVVWFAYVQGGSWLFGWTA